MRILYLFFKFALNYPLRLFFPRVKLVNSPKYFFGRTIFVSNHASSFMDPLVLASFRLPIIFFLTRSDVFKKWLKPIFWSFHMLPIYRERDGDGMREKNELTFNRCSKILSFGRSILIFGEGLTDDVFIRRLKPIKKGAIRIGFNALENVDWKKKIYVQAVGCNYSNPQEMRSDLLIAHSERICLNDYKEEFEENSNKAITSLTKRIEQLMQEQITHVQDINLAPLHESIMIITRKGMNSNNFDRSISLKDRWVYSRELANWINAQNEPVISKLKEIKDNADSYFSLLKKREILEENVYWRKNNPNGNYFKEILILIALFPFALVGIIECGLPYILVKRYVEKTFKRKVFWGSVKLIMGQIAVGLYNLVIMLAIYFFVYPNWWIALTYFLSVGITALSAYTWIKILKRLLNKSKLMQEDVSVIIARRDHLEQEIKSIIPRHFH